MCVVCAFAVRTSSPPTMTRFPPRTLPVSEMAMEMLEWYIEPDMSTTSSTSSPPVIVVL